MGVRNSTTEGLSFLVDSTSGRAFGPAFDHETDLDDFIDWYNARDDEDLRELSPTMLEDTIAEWKIAEGREDQ